MDRTLNAAAGDWDTKPRKLARLLRKAERHLPSGETMLFAVLGAYETERLGTNTVRNGVFIATDKRAVFYAKRLFGYDYKHFPYQSISSVETGRSIMGQYVTLIVSGNKAHVKWIHGNAAGFVDIVQAQIDERRS